MRILNQKKEVEEYGNPEFFILKGSKRRTRIRRDDVVRYKLIKENEKWIISFFFYSSETPYSYVV